MGKGVGWAADWKRLDENVVRAQKVAKVGGHGVLWLQKELNASPVSPVNFKSVDSLSRMR
jgi:hypothetical protein